MLQFIEGFRREGGFHLVLNSVHMVLSLVGLLLEKSRSRVNLFGFAP